MLRYIPGSLVSEAKLECFCASAARAVINERLSPLLLP